MFVNRPARGVLSTRIIEVRFVVFVNMFVVFDVGITNLLLSCNDFKFVQSLNISFIFAIFDVSKLLKSKLVRLEHFSNIPPIPSTIISFVVPATLDVSKLLTSKLVRLLHHPNMPDMSVTFDVLKLLTSKLVRFLQ